MLFHTYLTSHSSINRRIRVTNNFYYNIFLFWLVNYIFAFVKSLSFFFLRLTLAHASSTQDRELACCPFGWLPTILVKEQQLRTSVCVCWWLYLVKLSSWVPFVRAARRQWAVMRKPPSHPNSKAENVDYNKMLYLLAKYLNNKK